MALACQRRLRVIVDLGSRCSPHDPGRSHRKTVLAQAELLIHRWVLAINAAPAPWQPAPSLFSTASRDPERHVYLHRRRLPQPSRLALLQVALREAAGRLRFLLCLPEKPSSKAEPWPAPSRPRCRVSYGCVSPRHRSPP